jgi:transposase InsO family protein
VPDLPESVFRELATGAGDPVFLKSLVPPRFYDFIDACRDPLTLSRIDAADAEKFFEKSDRPPLSREEVMARLPEEYHEHYRVALPQDADLLPPHRSYDHKVELIPGNEPPHSRARPLSPLELRVVKRWLDDNLRKGFIRPSSGGASSPLLIARKPGGGVRICVDYRGVNNVTLKNRYPIPLIRETLDAVCKAKWFSKVDVIAAFNRVRIAEGHEWLTAFVTRFGLYESLVTPFGLQGAPATFQHYINEVLYDLLDKNATAYLDDVLIYSDTLAEHKAHVKEVLSRLEAAGLQIDLDKCEFHTHRTKYLGLIITPGGIEMDPEKVAAVREWLPPTTKRQLQRFLGFANFYRRFICGFSELAKPLHALTRKDAGFDWTSECQAAFEDLKSAFQTAPALRIFDWDRPTVVEVDASNWSAGGTLSQVDEQGELQPVAYFSSKHSAQECNYDIYDKELLAVIKALEEWRPELEGSQQPFEIITDHKNLQSFATTKQLSPRHMRWSEFLSRFNFRIKYRPGSVNTRADALSRKPEHVPASDEDDRLQARRRPLIDPESMDWESFAEEAAGLCLYQIDVSQHIDDVIADGYARSAFLQDVIAALQDPEARQWPAPLKTALRIPFAECKAVAGQAFYRGRLIIDPEDAETQLQLVYRTHTSPPGGHPGREKTVDLMNRKYWWPGLAKAVRAYVRACQLCTKTKTPRSAPVGFLKPLPLPFTPWSDISVDYVTPLPACERRGQVFRHVVVVVDRLTKMRHFIATVGLTAEELADRFIARVYSLHGCPETIVSDRGTQFVSAFWRTLSARLGITLRPSSAYHPQTNGQTERINAELEQYLRLYIDWAQDDWVDWLPLAEFAGNNATSETTGTSPFFASYGFHPRMGVEPARPAQPDMSQAQRREFFAAQQIADRFKAILDEVTALSKQAQDRYEEGANRRREDAPRYRVGDKVMLDMRNLRTGRPMEKLAPKWEGPFRVVRCGSHTVTLALPANMKVSNTFHVQLVRPHVAEGMPGQEAAATDVRANRGREVTRTDAFEEAVEWRFDRILDCGKADNGRWQYLVKWEGYEGPTWQPASDLKGCDDALEEFHRDHPDRPRPPAGVRRGLRARTK